MALFTSCVTLNIIYFTAWRVIEQNRTSNLTSFFNMYPLAWPDGNTGSKEEVTFASFLPSFLPLQTLVHQVVLTATTRKSPGWMGGVNEMMDASFLKPCDEERQSIWKDSSSQICICWPNTCLWEFILFWAPKSRKTRKRTTHHFTNCCSSENTISPGWHARNKKHGHKVAINYPWYSFVVLLLRVCLGHFSFCLPYFFHFLSVIAVPDQFWRQKLLQKKDLLNCCCRLHCPPPQGS